MDPRRYPGEPQSLSDQPAVRLSILGAILLCALIAGLLGDSLIGVYRLEVGAPIPRGWRWLLGTVDQTFTSQTLALLLGVVLIGFGLGGCWFLLLVGIRWLRSQMW